MDEEHAAGTCVNCGTADVKTNEGGKCENCVAAPDADTGDAEHSDDSM